MLSALDHTMDTEETLVKQPSEDIQTISKPIPKPRKIKRDETKNQAQRTKNQGNQAQETRGADENERKISK